MPIQLKTSPKIAFMQPRKQKSSVELTYNLTVVNHAQCCDCVIVMLIMTHSLPIEKDKIQIK